MTISWHLYTQLDRMRNIFSYAAMYTICICYSFTTLKLLMKVNTLVLETFQTKLPFDKLFPLSELGDALAENELFCIIETTGKG